MNEIVKKFLAAALPTMPTDTPASKGDLTVVPRLQVLEINIRKNHAEIESILSTAAITAVERGIEIGRALIEAKKLAGHGNYEDWLARNFTFTPKTAQNYVRLAKQEAKLRQKLEEKRTAGSFLRMKEALEFLDLVQGKKSKR